MRQYEPNYEYDVQKLTELYKKAIEEIQRELERVDLNDFQRANLQARLSHISNLLRDLNEESRQWVEERVKAAVLDGIAATLVDLGLAATLSEAKKIAKFNRLNKRLIEAIVADTYNDILAVTQNIERRVRAAVRQVAAEVLRGNITKGINGRKTINREILSGLRKKLGDAVKTGIVDAAGRRWKPEVYVDMLTRTKLMQAHIEAKINQAIDFGAYYGIISSHGAKDACRFHEGRIVKLTPDAPGDYPSIEALRASNQIFHPNCKHVVNVVMDPLLLPESVRERAAAQAERGDKALATGKRNPSIDDIA